MQATICMRRGRKDLKMAREVDIEKCLVQEIKKAGGVAYKWVSPGNNGVPDRIVILPGKAPVFVELKTDDGKLSPVQEVQIKKLRGLKQEVRIVYGYIGLAAFFDELNMTAAVLRTRKKALK